MLGSASGAVWEMDSKWAEEEAGGLLCMCITQGLEMANEIRHVTQ